MTYNTGAGERSTAGLTYANVLGSTACFLAVLGLIGCWVPFVGLYALPLSVLAFFLAGIAFISARIRREPLGLALAAITLSALAAGVSAGVTYGGIRTIRNAILPTEWFSAETPVVTDHVVVDIYEVRAGDGLVNIHVCLRNIDPRKVVEFNRWDEASFMSLTDDFGNPFKLVDVNLPARSQIAPHSQLCGVLTFRKPPIGVNEMLLALPARNFGGSGVVGFSIPRSYVLVR